MGFWHTIKMTRDLKVAVHALLIFSPDLAKLIVADKGRWMKSARSSVERGERVGDVAALVVIDYITSPVVATDLAVRQNLANNLLATREYDELLIANQAIIGMIANAKVLSEPDYGKTLGYVIAHRYAQALFDPHNCDAVAQDLMDRAEDHRIWMAEKLSPATAPPRSQPTAHSLIEQHLGIMQVKLDDFVQREYSPLTETAYQSYSLALLAINDGDPDAAQRVQIHTDALRLEIHRLNEWAWAGARKLIDIDVSQMATSLGSKADSKTAERCADIVQHTIEKHTKALIEAAGSCRKEKLQAINQHSISH